MPFTIPNTDDGTVHLGCSLHYFPGGIQAGGAVSTNTALQNAQRLAALCDVIVGNVQENAQTQKITVDKFNGFAHNMIAVNAALVCMPYTKGCEISPSDAYGAFNSSNVFPPDYYSHLTSWPNGPKVTQFNANIYIAQPGRVPTAQQSSYTDPRGWVSKSFPEQRARDGWHIVSNYNSKFGAGSLSGVYHDSVSTGVFNGNSNPNIRPDNNTAYTNTLWETDMWTNLAQSVRNTYNPNPGTLPVFANCFKDGPTILHSSSQNTINAVNGSPGVYDGGVAENWIRSNYSGVSAFQTETQWQQTVDGGLAVQSAGSYIWGVINLCNATAGSGTCPFTTSAQKNQWRRLGICTWMLQNRGKSLFEFVDTTGTKPYDEPSNNSFYAVNLGPPTESPASAIAMRHAGSVGNIYWRSYQQGRVFVNPTGSAVQWVADQDYYNVAADGTRAGTKLVANGATLTLAANDAAIGYFAPPAPPPNPTVTLVSPAPSSTVNTATVSVVVTAVDSNGQPCVACTIKVGAGSVQNMVQGATGNWTLNITLASGANTLTIKATDAAGGNTTITPSVTYTPVVITPTTTISYPLGTITTLNPTLQVLVVGPTSQEQAGGAVAVTGNMDGSNLPLFQYNPATGFWEVTVTLAAGSHTMTATAVYLGVTSNTDSSTFTISTGGSSGGGGGGGTTPQATLGGAWRGPWISQQPGGEED